MPNARDLIASAAAALKERVEEVNRLNVFPVPDGDTGINMSLTMDAVITEVAKLPADAPVSEVCRAVTHGSLMGARGNSGVILSQILRGMCEGLEGVTVFDAAALAGSLERSTTVAFQAVRKPVEGTMLTVIKDSGLAAAAAAKEGMHSIEALEYVAKAAFDSVRRTPDLLPVLKDNGVVDAGGYGLAILIEGFVAAAAGHKVVIADLSSASAPLDRVVPVDDWDDDEYLYCTEFLLFGDDIEKDSVHDYMSSIGGSELVVGDSGSYKVHVHTNDPGAVLAHVTGLGEVAEVHINNMRRQTAQRDAGLAQEVAPRKPLGFVAVAPGSGLAEILSSLGVDVVVSGGQTMNPSTQDIADAITAVHADKVIVLPNNKNIHMAATAAASVADRPVAVVPTRSVPQSFAALLAWDGSDDLESQAAAMMEAASAVHTGEVTTAIKDAKGRAGQISAGQVIGIIDDDDIDVIGDDISDVSIRLARMLLADGAETMTLLAGSDLSDDSLEGIAASIGAEFPDVEIETHRGEQPLYPVIMSVE